MWGHNFFWALNQISSCRVTQVINMFNTTFQLTATLSNVTLVPRSNVSTSMIVSSAREYQVLDFDTLSLFVN